MISERKLVSSHTSFWRVAMPLAEAFVRAMNLSLERFAPPLPSGSLPVRNALISELAFCLYADSLSGAIDLDTQDRDQDDYVQQLAENVRGYISRLERGLAFHAMGASEIEEAFALAVRLAEGIARLEPGCIVEPRPKFLGCGIVDDCEGDLLIGTTLYEVKNVDRQFRLTDIRQLLSYCALNSMTNGYVIKTVGLINARAGLSYRLDLNSLALAAAGVPAPMLMTDIASFITADRPSR